MRTYRQTLLYDLTTFVTFLAGEARIDSYYLMTSSCSLIFKDVEECAPTGVHDALSEGMVLYHVENLKLLNSNHLILFGVLSGRLILKITALTSALEMGLSRTASSLAPSMTAFLASAQLALLASQSSLRGAIEARVLNGMTFAVSEKGFETNVNTDSRMLARHWIVLGMWLRLTDNESIPVPISAMHKMYGLGYALDGTMQLDLEGFPNLRRDMQMLVISIQPYIAACAVLSKLDRMPTVRFLEPREPHIRNAQLFGSEKTLERFGETISQHLYRGCRHMRSATALKMCRQIILRGKRTLVLIDCSLFGYSLNSNVLMS